jgi:hypothetical protein
MARQGKAFLQILIVNATTKLNNQPSRTSSSYGHTVDSNSSSYSSVRASFPGMIYMVFLTPRIYF